ncbi:MAG: hypothetical protein WCK63_10170 [Betaproteobacteria bacterium]
MRNNPLITLAILLIAAILGVIGYKFAPLLQPQAELTLPASACTPGIRPCTATLPDGSRLELLIDPLPLRPLSPLKLTVTIDGGKAERVAIDFEGTQMKMGLNRPQLVGGDGRFSGQTTLPVCITGSMEWTATVLLSSGKQTLAIPFNFDVAGR